MTESMQDDLTRQTDFFQEAAQRYGHSPAIIRGGQVIGYREFRAMVLSLANKLQSEDIGKGERIGILAPNSVEYILLLMALWYIGAVAVPLNPRWPKSQIEAALRKIECSSIIITHRLAQTYRFGVLHWRCLEDLFETSVENRGHISSGQGLPPEQEADIMFTSGSAGSPKAVLHTLGNHYFSALGSNQNIRVGSGDAWLLALPLYHVGGMAILFRSVLGGASVVVPVQGTSLEESLDDDRVTHVSLVAAQLYRLLKVGQVTRLQKMKAILLGGGAIPENLIREAVGKKLPVFTSYGSSEMTSQITTTRPGDVGPKLLTSGKVLPYREVKIDDKGEILVKGKTLFKGYVNPDKMIESCTADGWFPTGDLGQLDQDGYLVVTGRKDNMFISGGENIQPEEIEKWINRLRGVERSIVVPVEHPEFGKRPVAFVKFEKRQIMNVKKLNEYLRTVLPGFKIPNQLFPWPSEVPSSGIKYRRDFFRQLARKKMEDKEPDRGKRS